MGVKLFVTSVFVSLLGNIGQCAPAFYVCYRKFEELVQREAETVAVITRENRDENRGERKGVRARSCRKLTDRGSSCSSRR